MWQNDTNNIRERVIASAETNNRGNPLRRFRRDISLHRLSLLQEGEGWVWGLWEGSVKTIGFIRLSPDDSFQLSTTHFSWLVLARVTAGFISKNTATAFKTSIRRFPHSYRASWYYQSFIYSPTDALVSCPPPKKNNIKIYIKTAPTCFGVTVTPSSWSALVCAY